jgi:hypothetical protein
MDQMSQRRKLVAIPLAKLMATMHWIHMETPERRLKDT